MLALKKIPSVNPAQGEFNLYKVLLTTINRTTFVASNFPPNPTSKIATSTYTKEDVSNSNSHIVNPSVHMEKETCLEKLEDMHQTCSAANILKASKARKRK